MVDLDNVDNTSDLTKPKSTATQLALDTKQTQVLFGEIPATNTSRLFGHGDNKFRAIHVKSPLSVQTTNDAYLTIQADCYTETEVNNRLARNPPINNPTFTGTVAVNGTLSCPQLNPYPSQNNLDTIKTPGLYPYDIGAPIPNAPYPAAWNIKTIEIGRENKYSLIVMAGDTDQMFLEGKQIMSKV